MQLTLEQQKTRLINNYMDILRLFKEFEIFNKYVPLQERACKVMEYAYKSNHDMSKLNIFLGKYLDKKFNAME